MSNAAALIPTTGRHDAAAPDADPFGTEASRWAALRRRDPAADGRFLYSVRSTGVYCHPSCAARPARPANVAFHATRADAERPGSGRASGAVPNCRRAGSARPPLWRKPAG